MKSLCQHMEVVGKETALGKLSRPLCMDARFKIWESVQSCANHVMEDIECVEKRHILWKERKIARIQEQRW